MGEKCRPQSMHQLKSASQSEPWTLRHRLDQKVSSAQSRGEGTVILTRQQASALTGKALSSVHLKSVVPLFKAC